MIKFKELPFLISTEREMNSELPVILTNYQTPISDMFYPTGSKIHFPPNWRKYQLSHRFGNKVFDHFLLTNSNVTKLGEFPLYPIVTLIHDLSSNKINQVQSILHKKGIEHVHDKTRSVLAPFRTGTFLTEILLGYVKNELNNYLNAEWEELNDLIDFFVSNQSDLSYEDQEELLSLIPGVVSELVDLYYSNGTNFTNNSKQTLIEEILSPLVPTIPRELFIQPFTTNIMKKGILSGKDIKKLLNSTHVDIDYSAQLDKLMEHRIDMADFDMDDITFYPELLKLAKYIYNSGYTNVYLEYEVMDGEWYPTKNQEILNVHMCEVCDPSKELLLIHLIEQTIMNSTFMKDVCDDLISMEHNEFSPNSFDNPENFGEITKLEIIIRDAAACITVHSNALSCTAYLDFVALAVISNSILFHTDK